jgi:hypothetical protein
VFTTPVDVATPQARLKVIAILYHYEQVWYAAWLPPKQQADEYVYGHAYAFKNTAAAAKTAPHHIWTSKDKCIEHEGTRGVQIFTYSMNITEEDIKAKDEHGFRSYQWRAANLYCQKGYQIRDNAVEAFEKSLRENIPTWEDSRGLFDRIRCKNIFDAIEMPKQMYEFIDPKHGFTVDALVAAAEEFNVRSTMTSSTYFTLTSIAHIITKPAIKKLLQANLDQCMTKYNDPNNHHQKPIRQAWNTFFQVINAIDWINNIWPDCPLNYYQTYYLDLLSVKLHQIRVRSMDGDANVLIDWLREHMPVASLFKMMQKYVGEQDSRSLWVDSDVGYPRYGFHDLNDTFSMAIRILKHRGELTPPKRWRINEFHDYVQAESWKIQNPNESLRQDLFPEPIRVTRNGETWSFFQPVDTHQLAMWGQAVRNCVGSASHYADDIKKRKHFIVLCMIDGKPTFTIQLVVDMGLMSVKQIAGVANQRLTEKQREAYTEAFREVLQQREKQLQSA